MWAQRKNLVILTVCVEDCRNPTINIEADKLVFKGVGGSDKKNYEVTIDFYKEVDPEVILKLNFLAKKMIVILVLDLNCCLWKPFDIDRTSVTQEGLETQKRLSKIAQKNNSSTIVGTKTGLISEVPF